MLRSKYLLILIIIAFISCSTHEEKTTKEINKIFSKSEITDLNKLVRYFEDKIESKNKNTNDNYKNWIIELSDEDYISEHKFKDVLNIYKKIDKKTFNEIWGFNKSIYRNTNDTLKRLSLAYDKKYHKFLELLGQNSPKMKWYSTKSYKDGDLPQLYELQSLFITVDTINGSYKTQESYDLNERLLITISSIKHFDNYYRKDKWIENKNSVQQHL